MDEFDLQALYRSVIIEPKDSDQASQRGSGRSVGAASSGRVPSIPPLRSTSRTRATSGSYGGLSPAESPDRDDEGTENWNDVHGTGLYATASETAALYEDEDRVYYHGGEVYKVTERVLRTSGNSSQHSASLSNFNLESQNNNNNRKARRSTRRDLLFEPTDIEQETRSRHHDSASSSDADEETEPLVYNQRLGAVLSTNSGSEENRAVVELTRSPRSERSTCDSACDSVPEPTGEDGALISSRSMPEANESNATATATTASAVVYVSKSMKS